MDFKYVASNRKTGKLVSSVVSAVSMSAVVVRLREEGLLPLKIYETKAQSRKFELIPDFFRGHVTGKELTIFTRQLAATLTAGLLLTEALETIADDLENVYFRNILRRIEKEIRAGADFSTALSHYSKIFPVTYIAIVKSGEASGTLHKTVTSLAKFLESNERLKEKVKAAVRYPMFVTGFAFIVVFVIVVFLIPRFQSMFLNAGAKLPLLTRIVVGVSQVCLKYAGFFILAAIASIALYIYMLRYREFKRGVDVLMTKIPIMGKEIINKALVARFCNTLGNLLAAGVGLAKSLEITAEVVDHIPTAEAVTRVKERVIAGSSLSEEIRKQPMFPRLISRMAAIGEKTGKISEMFNRTAEYYDAEIENALNSLTALIEPVLIIFIGSVVLVVVLALYLPIFNMASAVR